MTERHAIYVVIITYNGIGCIDACLQSLEGESGLIVHVLDNCSTDGTGEHVSVAYPWVRLTRLGRNLGFGQANNLGITEALESGADFVLLLNQDTWVPPGAITGLAKCIWDDPSIGACSPLQCTADLLHPDPTTLSAYIQPYAKDYLADIIAGQIRPFYRVYGMNAAVWLVRSNVFRIAGGFDPLFFMYGEDDDLLARWKHHSLAFALVPGVRVAHIRYKGASPPGARDVSKVERIARRAYSRLLVDVKRPGAKLRYVLCTLVLRGVISPLIDLAFNRDGSELVGNWLAVWRLIRVIRKVMHHAALTAKIGDHFLTTSALAKNVLIGGNVPSNPDDAGKKGSVRQSLGTLIR